MTTAMTANGVEEFTPRVLLERKPKPVFLFKIPTWEDRDDINLKIYRLGVRSVSTEQIRALVISELDRLYPEAEAAENAAFFEGHWQLQEMENIAGNEWWEREEQRLLDIAAGADPEDCPQEAKPVLLTTIQSRSKAAMLMQHIIDHSDAVREKLADQQDYERRYNMLVFRIQCVGLKGFKTKLERDEQDVVTPECVEAIRTEIDNRGWDRITEYAKGMYDLTETERKNFDLPLVSTTDPNGSQPESGE